MQSWRLLQLEPASLHSPDAIGTPPGIYSDGSHLPATLDYLARLSDLSPNGVMGEDTWIYEQVASLTLAKKGA